MHKAAPQRPSTARQQLAEHSTPNASLTIGQLATAANVGVETVRYYQRRALLAEPRRALGSIRRYGDSDVERIRFIKRAQDLGFSLDEIAELLRLQDGTSRAAVRRIAAARLAQIEARRADLQRMARALHHLIEECEHHPGAPRCPIVSALVPSGNATP